MGCIQSKKTRSKKTEKQLRILNELLSANGNLERVEILEDHIHKNLHPLVQAITDKMRTEIYAEFTTLHQALDRKNSELQGALKRQTAANLREQTEKLQEMEALAEKNQSLEDQITGLMQQNEDLAVQIDNDRGFIHLLLRDKFELKGALGRQTAENLKEKEQQNFVAAENAVKVDELTERLKEQDKKLQEMEALAEKNLSLEDQIRSSSKASHGRMKNWNFD